MYLLFFILGALFVSFISPILEELCNLLLVIIETQKGRFNLKISEYNKRIMKLKGEEEEKEPANIIGFQYIPEEEEEIDDMQEEVDD